MVVVAQGEYVVNKLAVLSNMKIREAAVFRSPYFSNLSNC
jgi:hypothetical protein